MKYSYIPFDFDEMELTINGRNYMIHLLFADVLKCEFVFPRDNYEDWIVISQPKRSFHLPIRQQPFYHEAQKSSTHCHCKKCKVRGFFF